MSEGWCRNGEYRFALQLGEPVNIGGRVYRYDGDGHVRGAAPPDDEARRGAVLLTRVAARLTAMLRNSVGRGAAADDDESGGLPRRDAPPS